MINYILNYLFNLEEPPQESAMQYVQMQSKIFLSLFFNKKLI